MTQAHILGYPRIGANRELKKAVEAYWRNEITLSDLETVGKQIRINNWKIQHDTGLDFVTVGDFSFYDHVLDTSALFGIIPERFAINKQRLNLDDIFYLARGKSNDGREIEACEMTKWFNTNYHYIVPEFTADLQFKISTNTLFEHIKEAQSLGYRIKPVLLGPLTLLWLGKTKQAFNKLDLLPNFITAYNKIIDQLQQFKIDWIQIDEPILTLDLSQDWQDAFVKTYTQLNFKASKCLLTTYFGGLFDNFNIVKQLPVHGLHIDFCSDSLQLEKIINQFPKDWILSLGIINGRNIWRADLNNILSILKHAKTQLSERLWVATSCSLLHVPVDLDNEIKLDAELKNWLAFAKQKIHEVATLAKGLRGGEQDIINELQASAAAKKSRDTSTRIHDFAVKNRLNALTEDAAKRASDYSARAEKQRSLLNLPLFPTTTIGSFPQTQVIRNARYEQKNGAITQAAYVEKIRQEIATVIAKQEALELDVLVHGEPERNDMVEYFGELLNGFAFTQNGWVQSYGSRCVKPPIILGDVSRTQPMTLEWIKYAQSLTQRPLKGMLTGPVTIVAWSFVRDDQPIAATALQVALALRDEVNDLEAAGTTIIQIDEPAFRESLPLRQKDWNDYFAWAVRSFRVASSGVKDATQIHTHMCYSEFNDVIAAIASLDADVITIECSRSQMELLSAFESFAYPNEIGPGVYDIHSPRIPSASEIFSQLEKALKYIPVSRLWVNPDCGLKTRNWAETEQSLKNMVVATKILRDTYKGNNK